MRIILRAIASLLLTLVALYAGAVGYLYVYQDTYVYHPGGDFAPPAGEALNAIELVRLDAADGVKLGGWYAPAQPGKPTILYFHGNAGNVTERAPRFEQVLRSGLGLLALSYRGFPGSGGMPSQQGFFTDALTAYDWLAVRTPDIVVFGESLGTGVATYVASERKPRALVLEAPFTATVDIAAETYPWVPVGLLMRDQFRSRDTIAKVAAPVLIVHGTADPVVPVEHGRRLFALAREPKQLAIVQGAHHSDLWDHGLWKTVLGFLAQNGEAA